MEIETSTGVYTTPEDDSYSIDFAIDAINHAYPGCTKTREERGLSLFWFVQQRHSV